MNLITQMRAFDNMKHRLTISFSVTMLGLRVKENVCSIIQENLISHCRNFSAFLVAVIN